MLTDFAMRTLPAPALQQAVTCACSYLHIMCTEAVTYNPRSPRLQRAHQVHRCCNRCIAYPGDSIHVQHTRRYATANANIACTGVYGVYTARPPGRNACIVFWGVTCVRQSCTTIVNQGCFDSRHRVLCPPPRGMRRYARKQVSRAAYRRNAAHVLRQVSTRQCREAL